ncbi:hypothetical protein KNP414_03667 [Paenibacillus mucilaginosus KNP414]|uniref:Uncharacterized protein n=1 Tax=Paenibacillus mucilaginosus (strain KNP414) TaxID=1036673 RepID=F8FFH8_PAEMK|nr:hypothetical protein KNP414_03667 [Paenibacillus mucilaginosus KNP414]
MSKDLKKTLGEITEDQAGNEEKAAASAAFDEKDGRCPMPRNG